MLYVIENMMKGKLGKVRYIRPGSAFLGLTVASVTLFTLLSVVVLQQAISRLFHVAVHSLPK
jgi:hypothetical protein